MKIIIGLLCFSNLIGIGIGHKMNAQNGPVSAPFVVNIDEEERVMELRERNFDSIYVNLLDPRNVSQEQYREVVKNWTELHQKIGGYIREGQFDWGVEDSLIEISNRIYFD